MKQLLLLCSLVVSFSVFAAPKVGDKTSSVVFRDENGKLSEVAKIDRTVESKNTDGSFRIGILVKYSNGNEIALVDQMPDAGYISDSQIQNYLDNCAALGGQPSTFTMKDTSLPTCILPMSGQEEGSIEGSIEIAAVPFGRVRKVSFGEDSTTIETLEGYEFGQ